MVAQISGTIRVDGGGEQAHACFALLRFWHLGTEQRVLRGSVGARPVPGAVGKPVTAAVEGIGRERDPPAFGPSVVFGPGDVRACAISLGEGTLEDDSGLVAGPHARNPGVLGGVDALPAEVDQRRIRPD